MPYITKDRRDIIEEDTSLAFKPQAGDYVYFYYKYLVTIWKQSPCFETAYWLLQQRVSNINLPSVLRTPASPYEYSVDTAFDMAWAEFKRRILDLYEDQKIIANGDVT